MMRPLFPTSLCGSARRAPLAGLALLAGLAFPGAGHAQDPAPKPAVRQVLPNAATATPTVPVAGSHGDSAYAAYQRGQYVTALKLSLARAGQNDPVAMTLIAELYNQGYGVPQDSAKARDWYEKAAALGNADAQFALGVMKLQGTGIAKDEVGAADLFVKSAQKGDPAAAYNLGLLYLQGRAVPREPQAAAQWFQKAADKDQPDALYALAIMYREGNGVPQDQARAAKLLDRAVILGHTVATVEYAIMTFNGIGVPKDEAKAAKLFRKAALAGNPIAQNRLARILSAGRGAPQDVIGAAAWHMAARQQGLKDDMLDQMIDKMTPADRAMAEAKLRLWQGRG
ncbi:sel1 repeat family protein [Ancylobacter sp. 6x-1]|uniref:Sel1 repeat family protein n=1 Tax=Ancylobacter crimeensis TaxID=2579147 RepID=A0ABT0DEV4_9HYPH|nr:tetratricopeptide repeat protein [Ancylobacter crimeensis]MCK0198302.1 sel1 repeat family protein [Ancylobacter crimeensis]